MKDQKLADLTIDVLKKRHKSLKFALVFVLLIMLTIIALSVSSILNLEKSYFTVFPGVFIPMLLINLLMIKKVRTEIESRNVN
jgi:cell division protein FtsX